MSREGFFSNGLTTVDLNTEGKLPVKRLSLITEVKDGSRSSVSSASNDDGRGSSSHVLIAVLFNTSRTVDSDTEWKAVSGNHQKLCDCGRSSMGLGIEIVTDGRDLIPPKSQNLCGSNAVGIEDSRDEVFDLPRFVCDTE